MSVSPRQQAVSDHFYRRIRQVANNPEMTDTQRTDALRRMVLEIFERATEEDLLHFSTVYARITYAAHKFGLPRELVVQERQFRRGRNQTPDPAELANRLLLGLRIATELTSRLFGTEAPAILAEYLAIEFPPYRPPEVKRRYYQLRVLAAEIDPVAQLLWVRREDRPELVYTIPYGEPELADSLVRGAVEILEKISGPFIILNLLNAQLREGNRLYPTQIVIEPDFLVNVTDVAGCFGNGPAFQPWSSLPKRLLPFEKRPPLVRGNIVNSFLDILIHRPESRFRDVLPTIFEMQPLELCLFSDQEVRQLIQELKHHFLTVQKFVVQLLPELDIDRETVMLEPTFLSPSYGLQGRLDLLQSQRDTEEATTSIVELKTSKIYKPNRHGIRSDNFIQTLLYDLMINRALGREANVRSYILYSVDYDNPVRYAPPEFNRQMEAIAARNQLVGIEMLLAQLGKRDLRRQTDALLTRIEPGRLGELGSFTERDHQTVLATYAQLDDLERRYFGAFLGFVAREQRLAKVGEQKIDHVNGLASLWLDERDDKIDRFELLDGLTFEHYDVAENILTLRRSPENSTLIKFRQGDIIALYGCAEPIARPGDAVKSQIFKSTIMDVRELSVLLRPRNPQLNDGVFRRKPYWSIEKDVLDSSFKNHYLGLYLWAQAGTEVRKRWLGLLPPGQAAPYPQLVSAELTDEQDGILRKIITAPDYFLLWGPPGTGKTSKMLHHLVRHLLAETRENILLVAYTNRAVDEICESIERITDERGAPFRDYLRIGSRLGTSPHYEDRLLQVRSKSARGRKELRQLIDDCRVVVGTVASVGGKTELFQLKQFDRIVVDEASQILEPLLGGILTRAPRSLLIGDHRQLPAVVQQGETETRVGDASLREIGLTNLGTSLFERLYLTARNHGWSWAYDQLRYQGRMHRDIMAFPALHFYGGKLDILPETISYRIKQLAPIEAGMPTDELQHTLRAQRLVFLSTPVDIATPDPKVNRHEAEMLVRLVEAFTTLYAGSERPIQSGDIGIITPYRAQIAFIRNLLQTRGYSPDDFTVDTVERYQGSAKRIVLMSLCANDSGQLQRMSQISEEGVDRKLNVAMTRARDHLVLVGCPEVLQHSEVYASLLAHVELQQTTA
ncbi:DNA replication ATP-dependent helicase Dna2 [Lewinella aquimaris]|uniref:DNA replication ATP-dependent helicase Dna2 n=1 Tax=Neolewinella aquimaris TaxID=1835722 RepID=A0A840E349_9BACT|nr:AAA domain-containing protein [Neolewinella aquimaris]MBB4077467.1 DNA replication ATP-dependent helicase Dna2 [Neolewinella aquimaris]